MDFARNEGNPASTHSCCLLTSQLVHALVVAFGPAELPVSKLGDADKVSLLSGVVSRAHAVLLALVGEREIATFADHRTNTCKKEE